MTASSRAELQQRVLRFMDTSLQGAPSEPFEKLALDIHAWQHARCPVARALAKAPATEWQDIPAVPVALFKQLPVGTLKSDEPRLTFRTSGTTTSQRGEHHMRDTRLYDHGSLAWARTCVPELPTRVVALLHAPSAAPDSSLSHMVKLFSAPEHVTWHLHSGRLDHAALAKAVKHAQPVFVAATAFALADWLDQSPRSLPHGSVVMVTGGFKGHRTDISDRDLYRTCRSVLKPARLITEYGMTELSSQLWGAPDEAYQPPPWLRVLAVDPESGLPQTPGQPGQLRFYDLANLDSTVAIETLDQGIVNQDGGVMLMGRLPGAVVRGCSLTVDESYATPSPSRR